MIQKNTSCFVATHKFFLSNIVQDILIHSCLLFSGNEMPHNFERPFLRSSNLYAVIPVTIVSFPNFIQVNPRSYLGGHKSQNARSHGQHPTTGTRTQKVLMFATGCFQIFVFLLFLSHTAEVQTTMECVCFTVLVFIINILSTTT